MAFFVRTGPRFSGRASAFASRRSQVLSLAVKIVRWLVIVHKKAQNSWASGEQFPCRLSFRLSCVQFCLKGLHRRAQSRVSGESASCFFWGGHLLQLNMPFKHALFKGVSEDSLKNRWVAEKSCSQSFPPPGFAAAFPPFFMGGSIEPPQIRISEFSWIQTLDWYCSPGFFRIPEFVWFR